LPSLQSLLSAIPDRLKPMAALGIGALILVILVLFHGTGLHQILVQQKRGERRLRLGRPHLVAASLLFGWSVFLMLSLHIVEIITWAFAITRMGLVVRAYDSIYFCANAYTTLGYGNVDLGVHWRNISPIIGISGLFTFAWTTSALVNVVAMHSQLIEQLEDEREREKQLRSSLRKDEWDALKRERDAERSEKEKTRTQASGDSFFSRRRIWKEEKKRLAEIRMAKASEISELRRKEHLDEKGLGSKEVSSDSEGTKPE
jgi:Ion channel